MEDYSSAELQAKCLDCFGTLHLDGKGLSRVPDAVTELSKVRKLKLKDNNLTELPTSINTGRKNGFTNVCERCKYVVNLELQICITFALSAKVWANTYIC